jgi:hypothetical protein
VFVLTSGELPEGTRGDVTAAPTPAELVERMQSAGVTGGVVELGYAVGETG